MIIIDGIIIAAVQEERFTRIKHTPDFPVNSIRYCLEESGLVIDELDAIVFYDKPLLKFERLIETYYAFAPKGLVSFLKAIPVWLNEKLFFKKLILDGLKNVEDYDRKKIKLLYSEHHLSHAASAFYPSPFVKAAILTIDGVGEWCTASIGIGNGRKIEILKELEFPHSVGLLYSAFTYYLGFRVNSGEYKLMGLAPYGNPESEETQKFIGLIKSNIVDIKSDGSVWLNQKYFNYATGLRMTNNKKWKLLFGFEKRKEEKRIEQYHCNLALAIQKVTEEIVVKMAFEAKRITGAENLCLAGGVALNCVSNSKLEKENIFKKIYIQPAAGDAGGALGASLAINYMYFHQDRKVNNKIDAMFGSYLGPDYSNKEIELMNRKEKAITRKYTDFSQLSVNVAEILVKGNVVGWFQDRMEFGPRALGNRSILGDPRNSEMQKKMNLKIKYREGFRPFAPSVLAEDAIEYFDLKSDSPYMLRVASVLESHRLKLPENYNEFSLWEKLYSSRSDLQAVTHLDYSARIQTVHKETNPKYWGLINEFKIKTGCPILINTSFNVRGEPIVCSPIDAYHCFMNTEMDYLVIGNYLYYKKNQPEWENRQRWQLNFKMD